MLANRDRQSKIAARVALGLTATAWIIIGIGWLVPFEVSPFKFGQQFIIAPTLALVAVMSALYAWSRATQRRALHRMALKTAAWTLLVTGGGVGLFLLAYSNCPRGVC